MDENDELVDCAHAAVLLGLSLPAMRMWRKKRYGPPGILMSSRKLRYRRRDVDAFVRNHLWRGQTAPLDTDPPSFPSDPVFIRRILSDLLTTRQAAALLGVPPPTLRQWRLAETGPIFIRYSRNSIRYRLFEIYRFRSRLRVPPKSYSRKISICAPAPDERSPAETGDPCASPRLAFAETPTQDLFSPHTLRDGCTVPAPEKTAEPHSTTQILEGFDNSEATN